MTERSGEHELLEVGSRLAADPRATRTLQALTSALLKLLGEDSLEGITVAELCRVAGVHRTTFYGHYSSVDDLAADIFSRMIDQIATLSPDLADAQTAAELAGLYRDTLVELLEHILSLRSIYRRLTDSTVGTGFKAALGERLEQRSIAAIAYLQDHGIAEHVELSLAGAYVGNALAGSLLHWVHSDDADAATRATRILELMPGWWPQASG